jgi:hypothetical protein
MPEIFDVYESGTQTALVQQSVQTVLETNGYIGPSIAPLVGTTDDKIKVGRVQVAAPGAAQIVARYAAPAVWTGKVDYTETTVELAKMDEMWPIEEEEWFDLTGDNEYLKLKRGVAILDRARQLQLRAETKTEIMRWAAFHDSLTLQLAEAGANTPSIAVTYNQPSTNRTSASNWRTRSTSTPVTDIRTAQRIPFAALSHYGLNIYMHDDTWEDLQYSKQISDLLKPNAGSGTDFFIPTRKQVEALLIGGDVDAREDVPGRVRLTITSAGYRAEGSLDRGTADMTYFLPRDYVLITTQDVVDGERIAEMMDGRVLTRDTPGAERPTWKIGAQTETIISQNPPYTQSTRQVCKRMPRINKPTAFVWLYVGA